MAGKKKEFMQCPHCGRKNSADKIEEGRHGFSLKILKNNTMYISCPCGISTKICQTIIDLKAIWNSRPNKIVKVPRISEMKIEIVPPSQRPKKYGED